jgi:hypothetical protein
LQKTKHCLDCEDKDRQLKNLEQELERRRQICQMSPRSECPLEGKLREDVVRKGEEVLRGLDHLPSGNKSGYVDKIKELEGQVEKLFETNRRTLEDLRNNKNESLLGKKKLQETQKELFLLKLALCVRDESFKEEFAEYQEQFGKLGGDQESLVAELQRVKADSELLFNDNKLLHQKLLESEANRPDPNQVETLTNENHILFSHNQIMNMKLAELEAAPQQSPQPPNIILQNESLQHKVQDLQDELESLMQDNKKLKGFSAKTSDDNATLSHENKG